ncbi:FadR/GntR family transcriptional regulator [Sulfobacillus harzensis]|uniref:FadR family transcriptional regulator n=1 Tax=Sulfobacillus harzensis TaxID=2729629 RepID=A0A7Y0L1C6_9FIRM|nr:FCD domain-containing protein [Sulfobacillus harzensis]NMP21415.1 FadR family transcriptional regulator [Sulfobacillus harzensis]
MEDKPTEALFREIRSTRGFEEIAMQIQTAVFSGKLKVGDRLPNERDLGEIFGVSRATLREALRLLEALGVVEVRRGAQGGTFIVEPGPERAGLLLGAFIHFRHATSEDLNEFRGTFEAETASWAARRATREESQGLYELLEELRRVGPTGTWDAFVDLDLKIHFKIAEISKNQIRIAIMQGIHEVFRRSSLAIARNDSPGWRDQQEKEIGEVIQAIAEHRHDDARQLMQHHVLSNIAVGDKS